MLEETLGSGGMAVVYRARNTELDREVAIKVLAEHLAGDPEFRERFVREAKMAGRLSHPNVVGVYDAGETDGRPYIVMEYVEGVTLADELGRRKRLPVREAVNLAIQACSGLEHAHANGLVHRDVKPQNLLLRPDGVLKVADFGIARATEGTQLTQVGTVLGTAAYLSPEQAAGKPVTAAADLYSLGAVLYELVAGRPPHLFETLPELAAKHHAGRVQSLRDFDPEIPKRLDELVLRCLSTEPAARPVSAAALASELAALTPEQVTVPFAEDDATAATVVAPRPWVTRSARFRRRIWVAAATVVALAAIVIGALALGGSDPGRSPPPTQGVDPIAPAADPADRARNLADWIREHAEDGG